MSAHVIPEAFCDNGYVFFRKPVVLSNIHSLSTGASREAPVDNECFGNLETEKHSLSTGASREARVDNECF